jgi:hypothetical protein
MSRAADSVHVGFSSLLYSREKVEQIADSDIGWIPRNCRDNWWNIERVVIGRAAGQP